MLSSGVNIVNKALLGVQSGSAAALTLYLFCLLFAAMIWSHPAYLAVLLLLAITTIIRFGLFSAWAEILRACLYFSIFIVLINLLVSRSGQTIIFESAPLPAYGKLMISVEALVFSAVMCTKLLLIFTYCWLFGVLIGADRLLALFSRFVPRSALIVSLATLSIPRMQRRLQETHTAMKLRGATQISGNMFAKLKRMRPLTIALVVGALEDSWSNAEALNARAYGVGPRTTYVAEQFRAVDWLVLIIGLVIVSASIFAVTHGGAEGNFFPLIDVSLSVIDSGLIVLIAAMSLVPLFIYREGESLGFQGGEAL